MNEIFIYDDIGPDWLGLVSGRMVISELAKFKGQEVTVRINSPGGWVTEGQAIYNALRRHSESEGKVTVEVDALAASAASFIAMAGDVLRMAENSELMIHRAWTMADGNAQALRDVADRLDMFDGLITDTYVAKSNLDRDKIVEMLAAETWLTAAQAVELGLADEISTPMKVAAAIKPGRYLNTPERFLSNELPREQARAKRVDVARQQLRLSRSRMGV
jgi:ATP-dependent Clp protease, protease subunit